MNARFEDVRARLQEIYSQALQEQNRSRYEAELWRYYGHLRTDAGSAKRVRFTYDLCQLARFSPNDKVILDAGCGFGAVAIILWLMGAREVQGIDISESRLGTFLQMIADFKFDSVHAKLASVVETGFPDGYFDMVLSNEAISHYNDLDGFLRECERILKPGGTLLIADGNNGANAWTARCNRRVWERFENGPPGQVEGHTVSQPYLLMRKALIQQSFPDIDEETAHELARRTSYMVREQIIEAVNRYRQTAVLPESFFHPDRCPVDPHLGDFIERLLHPVELAKYMETFGFRARYYAYFGGAGGNALVRAINTVGMALSPISIRWARAFRIVAIRQKAMAGGTA